MQYVLRVNMATKDSLARLSNILITHKKRTSNNEALRSGDEDRIHVESRAAEQASSDSYRL